MGVTPLKVAAFIHGLVSRERLCLAAGISLQRNLLTLCAAPALWDLACSHCFLPARPQSLTPLHFFPGSRCIAKACRITSDHGTGTSPSPKSLSQLLRTCFLSLSPHASLWYRGPDCGQAAFAFHDMPCTSGPQSNCVLSRERC